MKIAAQGRKPHRQRDIAGADPRRLAALSGEARRVADGLVGGDAGRYPDEIEAVRRLADRIAALCEPPERNNGLTA